MNYSKWLLTFALLFATSHQALAQQSTARPDTSSRYRAIFTVAGAGGGFATGVFAGLAKFDDAVNSDRKVWTTAILGGAGGAVGGYFLGRVLDKRRDRANQQPPRRVEVSPIVTAGTKGVRMSISF